MLEAGEVMPLPPWCYGPQVFSIGRRPLPHRDHGDWRTPLIPHLVAEQQGGGPADSSLLRDFHQHLNLVTDQLPQSYYPRELPYKLICTILVYTPVDFYIEKNNSQWVMLRTVGLEALMKPWSSVIWRASLQHPPPSIMLPIMNYFTLICLPGINTSMRKLGVKILGCNSQLGCRTFA